MAPSGAAGTIALLRDRAYGPFVIANLVSNCGSWTYNVVAAVVVFDLTGSALATGAVTACLWIASLALQPWVGALTDRHDRRRMLILGQSIALAGALAMAAIAVVVGVEDLPGPWPVYAATLVIGVGVSVSMPSMQALIPSLVSDEQLDQAVALNAVSFNLARAIGPAVAGLILLESDPAVGFAVNAFSYLGLIAVLVTMRPRHEPELAGEDDDRSVAAGLRWVLAEPERRLLLLSMVAVGFATDPVNTLAPPLAAELDGGRGLVGAMVAAFGVGAVSLVAFVGRIRDRYGRGRAGGAGLAVLALGIAGFGVAPVVGLALASMWLAGAGFIVAITSVTSELQSIVPEPLRGRVMALWGVAFLGSRPISAAIDGSLADLTSPELASLAMASAALVAAVATFAQKYRSSDSVLGTSDAMRPITPRNRRSSG
jgi:MFS family permease